MRMSGFTDAQPSYFKHQGEPGIQRRGDSFVVVKKEPTGTKRWTRAPTLDFALEVQAGHPAPSGEGTPEILPAHLVDEGVKDEHSYAEQVSCDATD